MLAARLSWESPDLLELFPFGHELRLEARVAEGELTIDTEIHATGDEQVPVSFGYHPYLRLPGSDRAQWRITLGAQRRLVLDDRMIPTGRHEPIGSRSVLLDQTSWDDAFDELTARPVFEVADGENRATVEFLHGYSYAQVFAPAGQSFVCFEPMTAPTNALNSGDGLLIIEPGDRFSASFVVRIAGDKGN
jgi:galactose mutarotase-like enzyme